MFTNPEFMLAFGFALGIVAGINIARFCWPDEGKWLGDLREQERQLYNRIRDLEKKQKDLENS